MLFASGGFLLFFAVLMLAYYLLPRRLQKGVLLLGSWFFYVFCGWKNLLLILTMSLLAYGGGRLLQRMQGNVEAYLSLHADWDKPQRKAYRRAQKRRSRAVMAAVVTALLLVLAVFKYLPWMTDVVTAGQGIDLLFPMGLSFFTFQVVGYVVDVYRGSVACERSLWRFCLFSCYFPQLVQGPISRYGELSETLYTPVAFDRCAVMAGLVRVALGYIKKLVIADTALIAVRVLITGEDAFRGGGVALLVALYSLQIYADFTGGMDIAIGCSEMLGIRLRENFDHPFSSRSIKEYWRRWHVSMGRWFTDYVFYPLSLCGAFQAISRTSRRLLGERIGKRVPVYLATLITWLLTGIWHGAGWNFALWGLLNGVAILIAQELTPLCRRLAERFPRYTASRLHGLLCCVRVFLLMGLFRTLDVYGSVGKTLSMWQSLFDLPAWGNLLTAAFWQRLGLSRAEWVLLLLSAAMLLVLGRATKSDGSATASKWTGSPDAWGKALRLRLLRHPLLTAVVLAGMVAVVLILGRYGFGYDPSQFIYNQF